MKWLDILEIINDVEKHEEELVDYSWYVYTSMYRVPSTPKANNVEINTESISIPHNNGCSNRIDGIRHLTLFDHVVKLDMHNKGPIYLSLENICEIGLCEYTEQ